MEGTPFTFKHTALKEGQTINLGNAKLATHLPLMKLLNQSPDIPKNKEVIVTCGMGYRGNIAASFLQNEGFEHVHSLAGGMAAWVNSGGSVV